MTATVEGDGEGRWIGAQPGGLQIAALLTIGTVGMEIAGIQPVLIGALVTEHRLTATGLGWASAAEFLALAVGVSLAGALFKPRQLRLRGAGAAIVALLADLLVFRETGLAIIVDRAVAGLAEGVLIWLPILMIARAATPARLGALYFTTQNIAQLAFTLVLPLTLMQRYGANGGFAALAGTALLALLACPFIPSSFVELPKAADGEEKGAVSPAALASLIALFLIAAFSIGLFAYLEPLSTQAHLGSKTLGLAVSGVLAASIVGSAVAVFAARHVAYFPVFVACLVINAAVLVTLAALPGALIFIAITAVFGFFWMFFMPFQLPFVIEIDPTRRSAMLLPGAQLLGAAAGPFLCSFFVTEAEARGALVVCGLCFGAAFVISAVLHLRRRGSRAVSRAYAT